MWKRVEAGRGARRVLADHPTASSAARFQRRIELLDQPARSVRMRLVHSRRTRNPEIKRWLAENPLVKFHFTPTSASWLNQVEGFFGILGKQSLFLNDFKSRKALADHIKAYRKAWNKNPTPFEWTKPAKAIIESLRRMLDRISTAVR